MPGALGDEETEGWVVRRVGLIGAGIEGAGGGGGERAW